MCVGVFWLHFFALVVFFGVFFAGGRYFFFPVRFFYCSSMSKPQGCISGYQGDQNLSRVGSSRSQGAI